MELWTTSYNVNKSSYFVLTVTDNGDMQRSYNFHMFRFSNNSNRRNRSFILGVAMIRNCSAVKYKLPPGLVHVEPRRRLHGEAIFCVTTDLPTSSNIASPSLSLEEETKKSNTTREQKETKGIVLNPGILQNSGLIVTKYNDNAYNWRVHENGHHETVGTLKESRKSENRTSVSNEHDKSRQHNFGDLISVQRIVEANIIPSANDEPCIVDFSEIEDKRETIRIVDDKQDKVYPFIERGIDSGSSIGDIHVFVVENVEGPENTSNGSPKLKLTDVAVQNDTGENVFDNFEKTLDEMDHLSENLNLEELSQENISETFREKSGYIPDIGATEEQELDFEFLVFKDGYVTCRILTPSIEHQRRVATPTCIDSDEEKIDDVPIDISYDEDENS